MRFVRRRVGSPVAWLGATGEGAPGFRGRPTGVLYATELARVNVALRIYSQLADEALAQIGELLYQLQTGPASRFLTPEEAFRLNEAGNRFDDAYEAVKVALREVEEVVQAVAPRVLQAVAGGSE